MGPELQKFSGSRKSRGQTVLGQEAHQLQQEIDAFTELGNKKLTNLSTPARNLILGLVLTVKVNYCTVQ